MFRNLSDNQRTLLFRSLYKNKKITLKEMVGGPSYQEQLSALALHQNWIVLNTDCLNVDTLDDLRLNHAVNALKHALQTYGPTSDRLPSDVRQNSGAAQGSVYHAHAEGNGGTYVLEWAIVDENRKIMALLRFRSHENYPYAQRPLNDREKQVILQKPANQRILQRSEENRAAAEEKLNTLSQRFFHA